jgi:Zn-finger nucleic acid-binding protein
MTSKWEREDSQEKKRAEKMGRRKIDAFLKELSDLSQRHGVEIGGCGECGSPWVIIPGKRNRKEKTLLEHLTYCGQHHTYGSHDEHRDCARGWQ